MNFHRTRFEVRVGGSLPGALHSLVRNQRIPFLAVILAAIGTTIASRIGSSAVSVLSLVGGRSLPGAQNTMGACYNSIVLTLRESLVSSEAALLGNAAQAVFDALSRCEVPAGLISKACVERGLGAVHGRFPVVH